MKHLVKNLLFIAFIGLTTIGCKKKITQFYVDYNSTVVIQSSFGQMVPFSVMTPEMSTNSEAEFESNDTRKDRINSIYLKDLILTIESPSNETFSFLNSIEVYVSSPNTAETKVAFKNPVPSSNSKTLVCDLVDKDLQEYIKDDRFSIRVKTVTDETIPQDVTIDVYSNFLVDAKLIK